MQILRSSLLLLLALLCSCQQDRSPLAILNPYAQMEDLSTAPSEVQIGDQRLTLEASLYRDFMPFYPPGGPPLNAVVKVIAMDSTAIQPGIEACCLWAIYRNEVWAAYLIGENRAAEPFVLNRYATGGPKWEPGVFADVVVGVTDTQGTLHLIKQEDVQIGRVD